MRRLALLPVAVLAVTACGKKPVPFTSDRISVEVRGSGPDIVLIPGLASSKDVWAGVAPALADSFRLHLVQVNGFAGAAPAGNAQGPILGPVADEIARYIREQRMGRPAIIGHSLGGTWAMMIAARHQTLPSRVMVVDMLPFMGPVFAGPNATADSLRPAADHMRAQMVQPDSGPAFIEAMFSSMTRNDSARSIIMAQARASNMRTVGDVFHEMLLTDLRPELERITVPLTVLYVVPPNAPVPPAQYNQIVQRSYLDAADTRVVRGDNANHFIQIDQPEWFVAQVRGFMNR